MNNDPIIPNAVGRLDDVTDAIRAGDFAKVDSLLFAECMRLGVRESALRAELDKVVSARHSVAKFAKHCEEDQDFRFDVMVAAGPLPAPAAERDGSE